MKEALPPPPPVDNSDPFGRGGGSGILDPRGFSSNVRFLSRPQDHFKFEIPCTAPYYACLHQLGRLKTLRAFKTNLPGILASVSAQMSHRASRFPKMRLKRKIHDGSGRYGLVSGLTPRWHFRPSGYLRWGTETEEDISLTHSLNHALTSNGQGTGLELPRSLRSKKRHAQWAAPKTGWEISP